MEPEVAHRLYTFLSYNNWMMDRLETDATQRWDRWDHASTRTQIQITPIHTHTHTEKIR